MSEEVEVRAMCVLGMGYVSVVGECARRSRRQLCCEGAPTKIDDKAPAII